MKKRLFIIAILAIACSRGPEGTEKDDCNDNKDNDLDGKYDCDDDGCFMDDFCVDLVHKAKQEEEARKKALAEKLKAKKTAQDQEKNKDLSPFFEVEGLLVQRATNGKDINWYGSDAFCKNFRLAGKANWRLPTREEALQIIKSGKLVNESSYVMWTSTKKGKKRGVIVGISTGAVNDLALHYDGECRARCVLDTVK
ncbi:MAG: DUF1566 domain-containing protein [Proteobacteria bacterium]|nr:DUF1566 domain-containing protein [Pseudomonadota bacterium]